MNSENLNPPTPTPPPPLPPPAEPITPHSILSVLLKKPQRMANVIAEDKDAVRLGMVFLLSALLFHAIFGLAIGLFSGWTTGGVTLVKAPLIALCALLLCLPSLYVFSCVAGTPFTITQTFMVGTSCLAMIGLLLIGLAPVAWLFAVSTESLPFVVLMTFSIWLISVAFAARYITKLRESDTFRRMGGIKTWFIIFIVVSLQMTTCMRPLLTATDKGWWTGEKKFFLSHFSSCFDTEAKPPPKPAPGK